MEKYIIDGGYPLRGDIKIQGAKNSVLPILAATVLNGKTSELSNVPRLKDVDVMKNILTSIGSTIIEEGNSLRINTKDINSIYLPDSLVREMRSSIILMGAILGRFGEVKIGYPGGCEIGPRPIDMHIKALRQMGAIIKESHGFIYCKADVLRGCEIQLDYPSVGATENIILAAVLAKGKTVIRNAAREPEIIDLQEYLNKTGARIRGGGTSIIIIEGVESLKGCSHRVIPDRIVTGTYLVAGAMTRGEILVKDIVIEHIQSIIAKLREIGCQVDIYGNDIKINGKLNKKPIELLKTLPFPGFPTDMQAQFMALLANIKGTSIINETVFENRFKHAEELTRMGANIKTFGKIAVISGVDELTGAKVFAKDLRGGAALILAGLAAKGRTEVLDIHHIKRGYENLDKNLRSLGASISCI